jgi:hypothetical protein
MNIQLIFDAQEPSSKWLIWKRNIGKKFFGRMITVNKFSLNTILQAKGNNSCKSYIAGLSYDSHKEDGDNEINWRGRSCKLSTDTYRNLTIEEYNTLSQILLKANARYNKKKDEFTWNSR